LVAGLVYKVRHIKITALDTSLRLFSVYTSGILLFL
jgi:hypothetical protein